MDWRIFNASLNGKGRDGVITRDTVYVLPNYMDDEVLLSNGFIPHKHGYFTIPFKDVDGLFRHNELKVFEDPAAVYDLDMSSSSVASRSDKTAVVLRLFKDALNSVPEGLILCGFCDEDAVTTHNIGNSDSIVFSNGQRPSIICSACQSDHTCSNCNSALPGDYITCGISGEQYCKNCPGVTFPEDAKRPNGAALCTKCLEVHPIELFDAPLASSWNGHTIGRMAFMGMLLEDDKLTYPAVCKYCAN